MRDLVQMVVFVAVFFGLLAFFLASRWTVRLSAFFVLVVCLMYYLFQLQVL